MVVIADLTNSQKPNNGYEYHSKPSKHHLPTTDTYQDCLVYTLDTMQRVIDMVRCPSTITLFVYHN